MIGSLEENDEELSTTVVNAYELMKGASMSSKSEENMLKVHTLLSRLRVLGLTVSACQEASKILSSLRRKEQLIGEFDVLIAGIILSQVEIGVERKAFVTRDEHFRLIRGIRLSKW